MESKTRTMIVDRNQRYIDHTVKEMLTQRVFQIATGYDDCNDCDDLRNDMILKMCADRLPQSGQELASQPTMTRMENSVTKKDLYCIGYELLDAFTDPIPRHRN